MKIQIVIPTLNRTEKLFRALRSIQRCRDNNAYPDELDIVVDVYFSDKRDVREIRDAIEPYGLDGLNFIMLDPMFDFRASDFWNMVLPKVDADAFVYLTDDVILEPQAIRNAALVVNAKDCDVLVGFDVLNATNGQPVKACYGMMGRRFIDRFPGRQVFCPDYGCLFIDEELQAFAESISKFYFCPAAQLSHAHPDFTGQEADETHNFNRRWKQIDIQTHSIRVERGLVWGLSFERIIK